MPKWGETFAGRRFKLSQGGKGSNQSVAAARMGGAVSFISKVGDDAFGEMGLRTYKEENIDATYVYKTKEHPTGTATILVDSLHGENAILIVPSACNQLSQDEVTQARDMIAASDVFLTQLELPLPTVGRGLQIAAEAGVCTILNPAPALLFPREWYSRIDYFTPNEGEAAALANRPVENLQQAEAAADFFLEQGVKNVCITLGKNGVLMKGREQTTARHVRAFPVKNVVDTTAAGDAFNGGLAYGLGSKMEFAQAVKFGCAVAAISVTREGATLSMPTRAEVDLFLKGAL